MRRFVTTLLIVLVTVGCSIPAATQATQPLDEVTHPPAGLERWYTRMYGADWADIFEDLEAGETPIGWYALDVHVIVFDSEEHAAEAMDEVLAALEGQMRGAGTDLRRVDLDTDLPYVTTGGVVEEEIPSRFLLAVVQDGIFLYAMTAVTWGMIPAETIRDVAHLMRDAEVGDEQERFESFDMSTGGLWEKLPTTEDIRTVEPTLVAVGDRILFPRDDATPHAWDAERHVAGSRSPG